MQLQPYKWPQLILGQDGVYPEPLLTTYGPITARSREISTPRDSDLDRSNCSKIWRSHRQQLCPDACQILARYSWVVLTTCRNGDRTLRMFHGFKRHIATIMVFLMFPGKWVFMGGKSQHLAADYTPVMGPREQIVCHHDWGLILSESSRTKHSSFRYQMMDITMLKLYRYRNTNVMLLYLGSFCIMFVWFISAITVHGVAMIIIKFQISEFAG